MRDEKQPSVTFVSAGMELRDWFAGLALGKLHMVTWNWDATKAGENEYQHVADAAYKLADAMLAERQKK